MATYDIQTPLLSKKSCDCHCLLALSSPVCDCFFCVGTGPQFVTDYVISMFRSTPQYCTDTDDCDKYGCTQCLAS